MTPPVTRAAERAQRSEEVAVLRIVVREGFSGDLAGKLMDDMRAVCAKLEAGVRPNSHSAHFAH